MKTADVTLWLVSFVLSVAALSLTVIAFSGGFFPAMMSDEWKSVGFFIDNGFWNSIACRHNGHPMIFPNLVYRILLLTSDGNALVRALATFVTAAIGAVLLGLSAVSCVRADGDNSKLKAASIFLAVCAIFLWLTAHAKLFWGMSVHDYIVIAVGVAALMLTPRIMGDGRWNYRVLGGVVLLATVCTFSFGFGAAVWGAVLVTMMMCRQRLAPMVLVAVAAVLTTVVAHLYLPNCDRAVEAMFPDIVLQPLVLLQSVSGMLGNAIIQSMAAWIKPAIQPASIAGAIGIIALGYFSSRIYFARMLPAYSVLVGIAWFAIGMVLLVGIGRSPFFVDNSAQILSERFLPLSVFFWASLFAVAVCYSNGRVRWRQRSMLPLLVSTAVVTVLVTNLFLIPRIFTFRFSKQDLYISPLEIKTEALRLSLAFSEDDNQQSANTLSFMDRQSVFDALARMQTEKWGIFAKFPRLNTVDQYQQTLKSMHVVKCDGYIETVRAGSDSVVLAGELKFDNGQAADDIVIAQGRKIIGRGFRAPFRPYANQARGLRYENTSKRAQLTTSINYVARLLGMHSSWVAVRKKTAEHQQQPVVYYASNNNGYTCHFKTDDRGMIWNVNS